MKVYEQLASQALALIAQLYAVESSSRERQLDVQQQLLQRQAHSVPVLDRIEALLLANIHGVLPGSLLGQALHYLSSQWPKLQRYVTNGGYPIDNNACENSIRPFVIGRRNWLFSDTVAGPTPAPTCIRYFRPVRSTASMAIDICVRC